MYIYYPTVVSVCMISKSYRSCTYLFCNSSTAILPHKIYIIIVYLLIFSRNMEIWKISALFSVEVCAQSWHRSVYTCSSIDFEFINLLLLVFLFLSLYLPLSVEVMEASKTIMHTSNVHILNHLPPSLFVDIKIILLVRSLLA